MLAPSLRHNNAKGRTTCRFLAGTVENVWEHVMSSHELSPNALCGASSHGQTTLYLRSI